MDANEFTGYKYVNENEFTGYITRGAFGSWKVMIVGQGVSSFEMPVVFRGRSRYKAVSRAQSWCRRQVRVLRDENFKFDPTSPSAGFETRS